MLLTKRIHVSNKDRDNLKESNFKKQAPIGICDLSFGISL